jgi:CubicO group peptidase (beta-lactamase class C family)
MKTAFALPLAVILVLAFTGVTHPVATASTPAGSPDEVGLSSDRLARIGQMLDRRIAAGDLAGAVAIVARKGKVAYHSTHGVMDLDSRTPMSETTMFRIASMTKPVVGVAIMMLVEEGALRLNDPVSRYIPAFRDMQVAVARQGAGGRGGGAGADPQFYTVPAQREITIKDLLVHVSGLGS